LGGLASALPSKCNQLPNNCATKRPALLVQFWVLDTVPFSFIITCSVVLAHRGLFLPNEAF
jgi:hypothetical protein